MIYRCGPQQIVSVLYISIFDGTLERSYEVKHVNNTDKSFIRGLPVPTLSPANRISAQKSNENNVTC